jgi:hypothetical protein
MESTQFEVLSVRPAPAGANYLARIAFAYRPSDFEPLRITHRAERNGKWTTYTDAEIDGARAVRVRSAFMRRSEKGDLYVQAQGIELPWAISRAVADA